MILLICYTHYFLKQYVRWACLFVGCFFFNSTWSLLLIKFSLFIFSITNNTLILFLPSYFIKLWYNYLLLCLRRGVGLITMLFITPSLLIEKFSYFFIFTPLYLLIPAFRLLSYFSWYTWCLWRVLTKLKDNRVAGGGGKVPLPSTHCPVPTSLPSPSLQAQFQEGQG